MLASLSATLLLCLAAASGPDSPVGRGWYQPVTAERVAALGEPARAAWRTYLERSGRMRDAYARTVADEARAAGIDNLKPAAEAAEMGSVDLGKVADGWFSGQEGRRIVANVLSYQLPFGAWNKHVDLCAGPRPKGGGYMAGRESSEWLGTIDNGATHTQIRLLARAWLNDQNTAAAEGARRGILYLLAAQNPSGGFPQVFPLAGGYHDAITYNDDAMAGVMAVLRDAGRRTPEFRFLTDAEARAAGAAFDRGLACILDSQVRRNGVPTAWGQQHDAVTLKPCGARNYEMASLSSSESAHLVLLLMELPEPSPRVVAAVDGAAAWFRKTEIHGMAYVREKGKARELVQTPGSSVWPRYSSLDDDKPLFGDRDFSVRNSLEGMSSERRSGYAWYGDAPRKVLAAHAAWKARVGEGK